MLRRGLLGCSLAVLLSLAGFYVGCSGPSADSCGEGTKWDEGAKTCIAEQVVECGPNTTRDGDKCVPNQEVCKNGQVFDAKEGKCVDKATLCNDDSKLDEATGKCIPKKVLECDPDTEEKDGKCVPKKVVECGPDTTAKDDKCVPDTTVCGPGTKPTQDGKCEAESKIQCGPGTEEKEGKCVPVADLCQPGTVKDDKGNCVVEKAACDKGTEFDVNTKKCVATDQACGPNTAFTNGQCVETDKVCAKGTKYDKTSNQCLPDYCKAGDIIKNGVCVSSAEELIAKKDVDEKENNDPMKKGTAQALTLKAQGSQLVFTGAIDAPKDLDGDSIPDQDVDVYEFTAKAGQWFKVSVQSLGLPAPAFLIRSEGTKDKDGKMMYEFKRFGSFGAGSAPARYVQIPADGKYQIVVLPTLVMASDPDLDGDAPYNFGPQGDANWKYVGYIEEIKTPTAVKVDTTKVTQMKGNLTNVAQVMYEMDNVKQDELLQFDVGMAAPGARMLLTYWDGTKVIKSISLAQDGSYSMSVPATGKLTLVVSWDRAWSNQLDFDIRAKKVGLGKTTTIKTSASDTFSFSVPDNTVMEIYYTADSGTFTSSDRLDVDLQDNQGTSITKNASLNDGSGSKLFAFAAKAASYKLVVNNKTSKDQTLQLVVLLFKANDLGQTKGVGDKLSLNYSQPLLKGEYVYVTVNFKEDVSVSGTLVGNTSPDSEDVDVYLYDDKVKSITSKLTSAGVELFREPFKKGTYLLKVTSSTTTPDLTKGFKVNFTLTPPPTEEKEPNDTPATANTWGFDRNAVGTFAKKDDQDHYKVSLAKDMAAGEILVIHLDASSYSSYECSLTEDKTGATPVLAVTDRRYGCYMILDGLKAGNYIFMGKYTSTSTNVKYTLSAKMMMGALEKESNDATTTALDVADPSKTMIYGMIGSKTDVDYFSFKITTPPAKGKVWELTGEQFGSYTSTSYYAKVTVVDASAQSYGEAQIKAGSKAYIKADGFSANTTYYFKVEYGASSYYSYYDIGYKFSVKEVSLNFEVETSAANDDSKSAQVLTALPVLVSGDVAPSDKDYYKFTLANDLASGESLLVNLNEGPATGSLGNTSSVQVHLYDSAVKLIDEKTGYTGYPKTITKGGLKKGDYYIMIDRDSTSTSYSGVYQLEIKITK
ncbi:MAG: hypothetical protein EP343_15810 [Deltaproteobacteria bacterium]|nr:MAG: hypothetical protein EP343_15810 [Deltaproteobacteria bacterium]